MQRRLSPSPPNGVRYLITDSRRCLLAVIDRGVGQAVPGLGIGEVRLRLRPEIRVRTNSEGVVAFVHPRGDADRTLEEALDLGWACAVEPPPAKPDGRFSPEQVEALTRVFERRMRPLGSG